MGLLWFLIVGLIAGGVARAIVPGRDPMGFLQTMLLGIVGSFVGGFIFAIFSPGVRIVDFHRTRLIGSIIGAVIALLVYRALKRQQGATPG